MDIIIRLQVYILSFLMLIVIYVQLITAGEKYFLEHHLFKFLILSTMFAIFMEATGWVFDGQPGQMARIIATAANALLLSCNIIPLMMWTLYVDFQIHSDIDSVKRSSIPFAVFVIINALFALTAPINNLYFYIDANNFYHRGDWAPIAITIYYALFIYNIALVLKNWKRINRRNRIPMLSFSFPPLLGFLLQMIFYGISFAWAGVSLSILMVYITIQNQTIKTDYLTGLYNRRQLDYYLENRIKNISKNQKFAGIMIDIDNFKQINDQYGHIIGDQALEVTASILRRYFHYDDFISRYAGDEFVILFDIREAENLEEKVANLHRQVALFNEKRKEPFEIQISVGYAIYTPGSCQNSDEFLNQLDKLMYENKSSKRGLQCIKPSQCQK